MQRYVEQIIEDMRQATENLPAKPYLELSEDDECLRGVMEYESTVTKPMQEWLGIDKACFPPAAKHTQKEIELLVEEILKLWKFYNFEAILPKNLPKDIAYKMLVDYFDKSVIHVSEGTIGIEFCNYEPENCPFPKEYCMCNDDDIDYRIDNTSEISILDKELKEILSINPLEYVAVKEMEDYVNNLIEDLNTATEKIINKPSIPDNIDVRSVDSFKELVKNPFLTIDELTGIPQNAFPLFIDMDGIQTRKVLKSMLQLMDAYKLKVHYPKDIPFEIKYDAMSEGWDTTYVKHLPGSGDDIDFCTNDKTTCPFGEYCDCNFDDDDFPLDEDDFQLDDDMPF
jgi:hypothetical protein